MGQPPYPTKYFTPWQGKSCAAMRIIKRITKKPTNIQHREHSRSVDGFVCSPFLRGNEEMMIKMSLLDFLAYEMKCEYLSDLRDLSAGQKEKLADAIESMEASDGDIRDWNDALEYLTGAQAKGTAADAKAALIRTLQKK